jgi:hypothetical protein
MTDPSDARPCPVCGESVVPIEAGGVVDGVPAHRDCLLRTVVGGIGHLENHTYWCGEMHDPDGGRSVRQSGREVAAWMNRHWIELMVNDS